MWQRPPWEDSPKEALLPLGQSSWRWVHPVHFPPMAKRSVKPAVMVSLTILWGWHPHTCGPRSMTAHASVVDCWWWFMDLSQGHPVLEKEWKLRIRVVKLHLLQFCNDVFSFAFNFFAAPGLEPNSFNYCDLSISEKWHLAIKKKTKLTKRTAGHQQAGIQKEN